ncbi:hypothetical protein [Streptomyces sp. NBC_01637]|uniref:hypothetical protein n=1 Tax=unclassified Streptomyces TaxID=2593676 RepID=UPI00386CD8D8|nr:N-terminal phage integrase SAM-like domain-containing protein [Streptomyces sp. NBC_01653]WTD89440.1 N-terminal phage integrase SAM-like domain-containing protein [Streptomyces sp. NBC_01637]
MGARTRGDRCALAQRSALTLNETAADTARGHHVDPRAGRITFRQFAEKWVATHTTEVNSRETAERRLRLHACPYIGTRPLPSFQPGHIRTWPGELEANVPAASHTSSSAFAGGPAQ